MMAKKKSDTRDAVETSIDLAKANKKGTWENINQKVRKDLPKWEDLSRNDSIGIDKKVILPIQKTCKAN
jgi:hypothetical protein